jgi:hypothetical protein
VHYSSRESAWRNSENFEIWGFNEFVLLIKIFLKYNIKIKANFVINIPPPHLVIDIPPSHLVIDIPPPHLFIDIPPPRLVIDIPPPHLVIDILPPHHSTEKLKCWKIRGIFYDHMSAH